MSIIPNGLFTNMPEKEYRQLDAINQSSLKEMLRSPAHYKWAKENPFTPTSSMAFGTAMHCFILEPSKFEDQFAVGPMGITDKRTKAWKDFEKDIGERAVISHDDYLGLVSVKDQIAKDHQLSYLFAEGVAESTIVWEDKATSLKCKARLDFVTPNNIIVDLKTSKDARSFSFSKSISDYCYHIQAAYYIDALCAVTNVHRGQVQFKFVVVENTAPWGVKIYRLGEESIEIGRNKYRQALLAIKKCRELDRWPGYVVNESEINLPAYMLGEGQQDAATN